MHLMMILMALGIAWFLRLGWSNPVTETDWAGSCMSKRWNRALLLFLLPSLLLIVTGLAVLCMGPQGQMVGLSVGWCGYWLALAFCGFAGVRCFQLGWQGWHSLQQVRTYPLFTLGEQAGRVLDTPMPFAALVGFWQPELVISQGLLKALTPTHLEAVIIHEKAHYYYRDTFWFFCLGWVRSCTAWLPNTEAIWQELLGLRELRADRWAAQQVDPLVLAESLLIVVSATSSMPTTICAAFSELTQRNRLEERIEVLLTESSSVPHQLDWWDWAWLLLALLPLAAIPFHFGQSV
ncbi:MAG: M56 family metallopeptidase [Chroococcidiopsidaceae cyanobacterium CP_BM_ER_R8_30]|nr:M56 family metallopeptidase [Chroococcidiopsidaceae cyanobacterium CP_BM_ER_R8_30]